MSHGSSVRVVLGRVSNLVVRTPNLCTTSAAAMYTIWASCGVVILQQAG